MRRTLTAILLALVLPASFAAAWHEGRSLMIHGEKQTHCAAGQTGEDLAIGCVNASLDAKAVECRYEEDGTGLCWIEFTLVLNVTPLTCAWALAAEMTAQTCRGLSEAPGVERKKVREYLVDVGTGSRFEVGSICIGRMTDEAPVGHCRDWTYGYRIPQPHPASRCPQPAGAAAHLAELLPWEEAAEALSGLLASTESSAQSTGFQTQGC